MEVSVELSASRGTVARVATARSPNIMGIVTLPPIPEGWWRKDQYRRILPPSLPTDLIDAAMNRAYEVFDPEWRQGNLSHPAIAAITLPGTLSLHFMFELGIDLLSVDKCMRYGRVIKGLRKPREYFAARTELAVAGMLRRNGHEIEFQPPLPNNKRADLIAESHGQTVYVEIKKLLQSDARWLLDRLSFALLFATGEMFRTEPYSNFQGLGYEIRITEAVFDILGGDKAANDVAISRIVSGVTEEARNRLRGGDPPFCFPAGDCVHLRIESGIQSSVSEPPLNPQDELRRSLAQHFESPGAQLHLDHAGLLIIESSSILDPSATRRQVEPLLCALGDEASQLSAAIFIPVYTSPPVRYGLFQAFPVLNPKARFPAHGLRSFQVLAESHSFANDC